MEIKIEKLRGFINDEVNRRKITMREFAKLVGVSHTTINNIMDEAGKRKYIPDLRTLLKIAEGTNTSPGYLFDLLTGITIDRDTRIEYLATRIAALSEDEQHLIERVVNNYLVENDQNST